MNYKRFVFTGFSVAALPKWRDQSGQFGKDGPFTLVKSSKSGALQFSLGQFRHGPIPNPTAVDLLRMAKDFCLAKTLGPTFDEFTEVSVPVIAGLSVRSHSDFIRVWYISDGKSFLLATYLHEWGKHIYELSECEKIIRSVRFEYP